MENVQQDDFAPEVRSTAIWGSEAAEALGVSPYVGSGPVRLWKEKVGQGIRKEIEEQRGLIGNLMQPVLGDLFTLQTGLRVRPIKAGQRHHKHEWMASHTDFVVEGADQPALLETKYYHPIKAKEYGESGSQDVPLHDLIQCVHEGACFGVDVVYLGVLLGFEYRWFPIDTGPEAQEALIEKEAAFWSHVVTQTPPPPKNAADILGLFPKDNGQMVTADGATGKAALELAQIKAQIDALEEQKEALEGAIKLYMGGRSVLTDGAGMVLATWKAAKDSKKFDAKRLEKEMPSLYQQFLVEQSGGRRFLLK